MYTILINAIFNPKKTKKLFTKYTLILRYNKHLNAKIACPSDVHFRQYSIPLLHILWSLLSSGFTSHEPRPLVLKNKVCKVNLMWKCFLQKALQQKILILQISCNHLWKLSRRRHRENRTSHDATVGEYVKLKWSFTCPAFTDDRLSVPWHNYYSIIDNTNNRAWYLSAI